MANEENPIYDEGHLIKPLSYKDIDQAFFNWWDKKLNMFLPAADDDKVKKVPIIFVSQERWNLSRADGLRDENGTLILPLITITRTAINSPTNGPTARIFADTKEQFVYSRQINDKSSIIANLNAARPTRLDPNSPIYEIYTSPAPRHNEIIYDVRIWSAEMNEMNIMLQKYEMELDYNSVKSFQFSTTEGFYFIAFQEEGTENESNLDDYSNEERKIRHHLTFKVPGYTLPLNSQKKSPFKRYFSQTKLVIKEECDLTEEEFKKL